MFSPYFRKLPYESYREWKRNTHIQPPSGHILLVFLHRAVKGHKPPWASPDDMFGNGRWPWGCWKKTQWEKRKTWVQPLQVELEPKNKQATYIFFDGWKVFAFFKIDHYLWQRLWPFWGWWSSRGLRKGLSNYPLTQGSKNHKLNHHTW